VAGWINSIRSFRQLTVLNKMTYLLDVLTGIAAPFQDHVNLGRGAPDARQIKRAVSSGLLAALEI